MPFYDQDIVMAFWPPEYCRLFAQKKAYQGGVTGTLGPPLATPLVISKLTSGEGETHTSVSRFVTSIVATDYLLITSYHKLKLTSGASVGDD